MRHLSAVAVLMCALSLAGCSATKLAETASSEPTPSPLATWAAQVCVVAQKTADDFDAAHDGIDPNTLSLADRIERAQLIGTIQASATRRAEQGLLAITPPSDVSAYHNALIAQAQLVAEAFERLQQRRFSSAEDIEAMNAEVGIAVSRGHQIIVESRPPDEAVAALRAVTRCRNLSLR